MTTSAPTRISARYLTTVGFAADLGGRGFHLPNDLAFRSDGRIYVLSRSSQAHPNGTRIGMTGLDDEFYGEFASRGTGDGQMIGPTAIEFDSSDRLFLADEQLHRISIFDAEGNFLSKWGEHGSEPGQLKGPAGIAFDSRDRLFVSDQWNNRIQVFTQDGEFLYGWGEFGDGPGQFNMPWGITADSNDGVYVADWRNDRIQRFSPDGEHIATFGTPGRGEDELYRPADVAVDKEGFVYVADWGNHRVKIFDPDGTCQASLKGEARLSKWAQEYLEANADENRARQGFETVIEVDAEDPHEVSARVEAYFWNPMAVEIDSERRLHVVDTARHRFQVFEIQA